MASYVIYSWNINGIRASIKRGLGEWITNSAADIICFQETKAHADQLPTMFKEINGYLSEWVLGSRKGYSGVGTMYQKDKQPIQVTTSIGVQEFDDEGRVLIFTYPEFTLFNIYFPNGKKNKDRLSFKMGFYEQIYEICKDLLQKGESIVICGDVNTAHREIDLAHPKPNSKSSGFLPEERKWIDEFLDLGFVDSYRHLHGDVEGAYTWWTRRVPTAKQNNVGWRIDYFFVSKNLAENLVEADIYPEVEGSDHCPISITLRF